MERKRLTDFRYAIYRYCNKSVETFYEYSTTIVDLIQKYMNLREVVPVAKKFDTHHRAPIDFVPDIDYEDTSFPLDLLFKEQFERTFDKDLSMVRIHTGEYSHQVASKHGAKAVTMGNSIFFARGMYSPYTEEGLALLAHEIEHVVQYNDKDSFFTYDEDIAIAEYMAESVESQVKNMKLHSVNSGVFNKEASVDRGNPENIENDVAPEIMSSSSLDDFSSNNNEIRYEITCRNGKVYNISKKEREELVRVVSDNIREHIMNECSMLSDVEKDKYLIKVLKYVQ